MREVAEGACIDSEGSENWHAVRAHAVAHLQPAQGRHAVHRGDEAGHLVAEVDVAVPLAAVQPAQGRPATPSRPRGEGSTSLSAGAPGAAGTAAGGPSESPAFTGRLWSWKDWNLSPADLLDALNRGDHGGVGSLPSILVRPGGTVPVTAGVAQPIVYSDEFKQWRTEMSSSKQQRDADAAAGVTVPQTYLRELGAIAFALMTAGKPLLLPLAVPTGESRSASNTVTTSWERLDVEHCSASGRSTCPTPAPGLALQPL